MDNKVLLERLKKIEEDLNYLCCIHSATLENTIKNIKDIVSKETGNSLIFHLGENQAKLIDEFNNYTSNVKSISSVRLLTSQLIQDIKKVTEFKSEE